MRILTLLLCLVFACSLAAAQSKNANTVGAPAAGQETAKPKKKRGPVFSANKEQKQQAQEILKQRGFYSGEITGKLNDDTRAGLKQYQKAEGLKVTGTLNAPTLEKMNIPLTDKQKDVLAKQKAMKESKPN